MLRLHDRCLYGLDGFRSIQTVEWPVDPKQPSLVLMGQPLGGGSDELIAFVREEAATLLFDKIEEALVNFDTVLDARAAVRPPTDKERDFLQSLDEPKEPRPRQPVKNPLAGIDPDNPPP